MATISPSRRFDMHKYNALDDPTHYLRVLQILNIDSIANCVECSLTPFRITEAPPYLALSYAWGPADGSPAASHVLPCTVAISTGYADSGYVDITENLYLLLQELHTRSQRNETSSAGSLGLYLWTDAVCIDQDNMDERIQQVRIMDQIYSLASSVVVWLGPDADNSMPALIDVMTKCETLGSILGSVFADSGKEWGESLRENHEELLSRCGLPGVEHALWTKLIVFYERRWFTRLWVVQ